MSRWQRLLTCGASVSAAVLLVLTCVLSDQTPSITRASDAAAASDDRSPPAPGPAAREQIRFRRPVALVLVDEGKLLLTANRLSGTVSVIDTKRRTVVAEHSVCGRLSDLTALPGSRFLLATDEIRHQLLLLERQGLDIQVVGRIDVPPFPVSVRTTDDGRRCFVASLWSRQLTVVDLNLEANLQSGSALRAAVPLSIPFAPRGQLWLPAARRLIVADAFGGQLAVVDPERNAIESVRQIPAHNIGGLLLGPDGKSLLITHQILNPRARTDANDVHWGILLTNMLRVLSLEALLNQGTEPLRGSESVLMGEVGQAGGDPAGIALAPDGRYVVALAGVGEVTVVQPAKAIQYRMPAGIRPTAVLAAGDGVRVFAADTLGDAVYLLDAIAGEPMATIPLGPRPALTAADRGEQLFYSARQSHDGWMSCHSCHPDGHSNGLLNDNLGDGSFDAPKRVPSLLGTADTAPWAWDGGVADLESQIRKSVTSTMRGKALTEIQAADLAAFLQTLPPPPGQGSFAADKAAIERGQEVFHRNKCQRCHAPPAYTTSGTYDVGLADEAGNTEFNPPSLRGVSQRDALFHDNRARSLEEVFTRHKHQLGEELSPQALSDLLEFLRSL